MDFALTITVHLDHVTASSAPTIRRSLGDIMERQQILLLLIMIFKNGMEAQANT